MGGAAPSHSLYRALGTSRREQLSKKVEAAFATLRSRYRDQGPGFNSIYEIRLDDLDRSWYVEVGPSGCRVSEDPPRRIDATIGTDAATWLELRAGDLSGLEAFRSRRLWTQGNLHLAISFEGLFELPGGRPPLLRMHDVTTGRGTISTLTAGTGDEVALLIHGLGANKASMLETVTALAPRYTVHAIDLPGFGESSKPARAPYDPAWFARAMVRLLDALEVEQAHLVGNSMGGRISIELGLAAPDRVSSINLLAPSLAWRKHREFASLLKLVHPGVAAVPHRMSAALVRRQFWSMFAHPERIDPAAAEAACGEFVRTYAKAQARVALLASARNIVLEEPYGPDGFWDRVKGLTPPSLFIWGEEDALVPIAFSHYMREALPDAVHAILEECGHVPQLEQPERTHELLVKHMRKATRKTPRRRIAALSR